MRQIKILSVVGARPNFVKIAPFVREVRKHPHIEHLLTHTGQHYDWKMNDSFFEDLGIDEPDHFLGIGSGTHAVQTAKAMTALEKVFLEESPDLIVVVGDVNSTLAAALTAKKLHIPVAHIEAGLRSFDELMPEEVNRVLTDYVSDHLFVTEDAGIENLKREGSRENKIHLVGNIMIDSLIHSLEKINSIEEVEGINIKERDYLAVTLHRPSNVDDQKSLSRFLDTFEKIQKKIDIIFPVHPRTMKNLEKFGLKDRLEKMKNVTVTGPMSYLNFLALVTNSKGVLTDSGGIQEETTYFGIPCITLRKGTERPSTVEIGSNILTGVNHKKILEEALKIVDGQTKKSAIPPLWDGRTAQRILEVINQQFNED